MRFSSVFSPFWLAKFVTCFMVLTSFSVAAREWSVEADAATPYSHSDLEAHLAEIDRLLGPLKASPEVQIRVGSRLEDSIFDRHLFQMYVGLGADPKHLVVLTHEYGHALLEKNLTLNSPAYRQFAAQVFSRKNDRRLQKAYLISSALHEFFADVVAVSVHKNPQILRNLTLNSEGPLEEGSWEHLITRDFENKSAEGMMAKWEEYLPLASFAGETYYVLLPSRWEWWMLVQGSLHQDAFRKEVLFKTYRAVEKVMNEVLTWEDARLGKQKLQPEVMKELNKKLISELRAAFK